jgi:hypothetical protein
MLTINPFSFQAVSNAYRHYADISYLLVSRMVSPALTYALVQIKNLKHCPMSSLHLNWNWIKEDEQWGEAPTFKSLFDEVGDYTQRIILHNNTYFERQDVMDQCIYATHMSNTITEHEGFVFYVMFQTDIEEAPTYTQAIILITAIKHYTPFLDGCPLTLYKRRLNIPHSTHDFLLVLC